MAPGLDATAIPEPVEDAPTRPVTAMDPLGATFCGELATFPLPDVLEFLRLQGKTGRLVVESARGASGEVRLVGGRIAGASAPGAGAGAYAGATSEGLRREATAWVREMLAWRDASFAFHAGEAAVSAVSADVQQVLLAACEEEG